jgi:hypothetical protein
LTFANEKLKVADPRLWEQVSMLASV